jgi:hypothetical protein
MLDPEEVRAAAALQRRFRGWFIFWSPALRKFTAIAGFVPDQAVLINEPSTHVLLQRIGAIELAVSVGAPIDVGAQCRTEARPAPGSRSDADRAARPHHSRGRHSLPRGHASRQGAGGDARTATAPSGVPAANAAAAAGTPLQDTQAGVPPLIPSPAGARRCSASAFHQFQGRQTV